VSRTRDTTGRPILVIEDDADLRESLAATLEDHGYAVVTAANGHDGLLKMRAFHPAAVVLDVFMPGMDGWQFRLEQRHDPALSSTPVVAMSASHSAAAAAIDADLYLEKPFAAAAIVGAVETVLLTEERKQETVIDAQTERLIALGTLAAGVAHEINNPLTYVLLNLSAALKHLATVQSDSHGATIERIDRLLRDATEGSERIRSIVHGIRLFSHSAERSATPVDVRTAIESALRLVMNELRMRTRLTTDLDTVPLVLADESQLGQVFLNLLTNAIQAIPEGDPTNHEIRVATRTDGQGRALIEVVDTGGGIPLHLHTRIFDPFFTTKPTGEGTGLGLSISHGIVRALGGEITVKSEVGRGSTFRVAIPATGARRRDQREPLSLEVPGGPQRLRVLVVDDEPAVCAALASALAAVHDVVEATSAREALDRIAANPTYDVLLCDVQMPGMSGIELFRRLRSTWPELRARVIFMTSGGVSPDIEALLAAAKVPVLAKPLAIERLHALLASVGGTPL
jgi:signal transduction histidine kinase